MISNRKAALIAAGVIGAAALVAGAAVTSAQAQQSASINITTITGTDTVRGTVHVEVVCPADVKVVADATVTQGSAGQGQSDLLTCTGSPQQVDIGVTAGSYAYGPGRAFASAALMACASKTDCSGGARPLAGDAGIFTIP